MFMIFTFHWGYNTIPPYTLCTSIWPKHCHIVLTERSLNCFRRINNRTGVCFYIPRQIGLKMIYPVIQIFINIWYWVRPSCIRLLWLWTFKYMWILVLHFLYPVFVRLSIFSPNCRRGIFRCSLILTSDSMCIYFFTSFIYCIREDFGMLILM